MTRDYRTVYEGGLGEIIEKKSRFIATISPVTSEEEALSFIERTKKTYWDARHNCYAYIIGRDPSIERSSDDGEPAKTAGRPMLEVLQREGLINVAVVVTRYFGGTLLGTGGLVRAYTEAVKEGLSHSSLIEKIYGHRYLLETDYNGIGKLQYLLAQDDLPLLSTEYTEKVTCTFFASEEKAPPFLKKWEETTGGQGKPEKLEGCFFSFINGKAILFPG